jgi:outer membrane protein TolC
MAEQDVRKAHAAVKAAKVDYLPNVAIVGGYAKQTAASYIQQDIDYIGVTGSYTFFEWGKKKYTVREREKVVALAEMKLEQTQDEVRQKAAKAFRTMLEARAALVNAQEMVPLRQEAAKAAAGLAAKLEAAKKLMEAEVDLVKADLAYRVAVVELSGLVGKQ